MESSTWWAVENRISKHGTEYVALYELIRNNVITKNVQKWKECILQRKQVCINTELTRQKTGSSTGCIKYKDVKLRKKICLRNCRNVSELLHDEREQSAYI